MYYHGLVFKYLDKNDLRNLTVILSKDNVCKYLFFGPNKKEETEFYFTPILENLENISNENDYKNTVNVFSIKKDNIFLGICFLNPIEFSQDNYTIGFILEEEFWGQGIGSIVGEFLVKYAREILHARKLTGECFINNLGSQKIIERLGFVQEGVIKKQYWCDNQFVDNLIYGLFLVY